MVLIVTPKTLGGQSNIAGISLPQTVNNERSSEDVMKRAIVRRSWNGKAAQGVWNGYGRINSQSLVITNQADFLARRNYAYGTHTVYNKTRYGTDNNSTNFGQKNDNTNIPATSGTNGKIQNSSQYINYKNLAMTLSLYNHK